jgi:hypothetical protein
MPGHNGQHDRPGHIFLRPACTRARQNIAEYIRASTTDLQLSVVPTTNQKHSARTYHTVSRSNSRNSWLGGRHGRAHMHAHAETQLPKCQDRQGKALHPAASIPPGPERETREQHIPRSIHSGIYAYPCPRSAASYARPPVLSMAP